MVPSVLMCLKMAACVLASLSSARRLDVDVHPIQVKAHGRL